MTRRTPARPVRPRRIGWLAGPLLLVLAACGAPPTTPDPTPDPTPDLTVSGVQPSVALPGAEVTIVGTGFADDQAVAFDGVLATVVSRSDTSVVVRVPETYGYPVVSVDDVSAERLLFVGSAYAGATALADVQAALDALEEGAALRLGAGTYTGGDLVVDNRMLFGSGADTAIEASGDVRVLARSGTVATVAELALEADTVEFGRGRLSTAAHAAAPPAGGVLLDDVSIAATLLLMTTATHLDVTLREVTAEFASVSLSSPGATLTIDGGALTADVIVVSDVAALALDGATLTSVAGSIVMTTSGSVTVDGSAVTSADGIVLQAFGGVRVDASAFTSLVVTVFQADTGAVSVVASDVTAAAAIAVAQRSVALHDVVIEATAGDVVLQSQLGNVTLDGATVTPSGAFVAVATQGAASLRSSEVTTGGNVVVLQAMGPVLVQDATLTAATDVIVGSMEVGEVVIEGSLLASGVNVIVQGTGAPYAGANGTVRLQGNVALTAAATVAIVGGTSDVILVDNGPIEGNDVFIQSTEAHVTLRGNERIESATDVIVQAVGAGGRLGAVDNRFVADDGAGTIVLETVAGELTQSGNVFEGTTSFPNNE